MTAKHLHVRYLAVPAYAAQRSLRRSARIMRLELASELFGTGEGL